MKMDSNADSRLFVESVTGVIPLEAIGICDAHNHLWIEKVEGNQLGSPILNNFDPIKNELIYYRRSGGSTIVDCQPGGCGRDGRVLKQLSLDSGVQIISVTGFHLPKYYPSDFWLYQASADQAKTYFISEIKRGLVETLQLKTPVKAGLIKIACQSRFQDTPQALLEAAADTCLETGIAIEAHTEKGSEAEIFVDFFLGRGVPAERLVICHIDKRPDFSLHHDLATTGILLEYDTCYRPKYEPEKNLWPLIQKMIAAGLENSIALATDMAEIELWSLFGHGPGLGGFLTIIGPRLKDLELESSLDKLLGGNIASRLAMPYEHFERGF
jgi:phosphotriesterase-related protein